MRRPKLGTIDSFGVRIANRTAVLQKLCFLGAVLFSVGVVTAATFELVGTEWGFAGETSKSARFVQFRSDGKVGGHSGCNRFTGTYTQKDDTMTIGPLASTRMACQPEVMEREQQFLAMLSLLTSSSP
jgi:META domain